MRQIDSPTRYPKQEGANDSLSDATWSDRPSSGDFHVWAIASSLLDKPVWEPVKYFFLSDGWIVGRVWEFGGLWDERAWRRPPHIQRMQLSIVERGERLWLHQVEEAVLMVEVRPSSTLQAEGSSTSIGQVVLKRLITAEQVLELLCGADLEAKS